MQRQKYVSMDKPQLKYTVVTKYFVEAEILFYGSTSLEMITTEILMRTFWGSDYNWISFNATDCNILENDHNWKYKYLAMTAVVCGANHKSSVKVNQRGQIIHNFNISNTKTCWWGQTATETTRAVYGETWPLSDEDLFLTWAPHFPAFLCAGQAVAILTVVSL